ncbi:STAS-like domain-containing protein [Altericroceibacterium endophyticum]|uniref:DUF4325 domain-containing protein n=1 Tax=Altericroceibacterium endophyticum TaxID=1808508 RepID=A0A6I4T3L6_9SPHN|nr:STAS-like domain-containing protein [Altericroceibacterium endophyticum]MXO64869.1 DUF4325 domain-containing protein [Altericroceibacterium endophyticum]
MVEIVIDIAKDFSRAPAGRFVSDGPNSGERFREQFLLPALHNNQRMAINLDGTRGLGSSFLEEAFGGLNRAGFSRDILLKSLKLISRDSSLVSEIQSYWQ